MGWLQTAFDIFDCICINFCNLVRVHETKGLLDFCINIFLKYRTMLVPQFSHLMGVLWHMAAKQVTSEGRKKYGESEGYKTCQMIGVQDIVVIMKHRKIRYTVPTPRLANSL